MHLDQNRIDFTQMDTLSTVYTVCTSKEIPIRHTRNRNRILVHIINYSIIIVCNCGVSVKDTIPKSMFSFRGVPSDFIDAITKCKREHCARAFPFDSTFFAVLISQFDQTSNHLVKQ